MSDKLPGKLEKVFDEAASNFRYNWGIVQFERYLRQHPNLTRNELVLTRLGLLYDHLAMKERTKRKRLILEREARSLYQQALKINPQSPRALWGMGRIWWHRRSKRGIAFAKKAYRLAKKVGDKPIGLYAQNIGSVYRMVGDDRRCEYWYQRGVRESPTSWSVYFNITSFYRNSKKNERKARFYGKKLKKLFQRETKRKKQSRWGKIVQKFIDEVAGY